MVPLTPLVGLVSLAILGLKCCLVFGDAQPVVLCVGGPRMMGGGSLGS